MSSTRPPGQAWPCPWRPHGAPALLPEEKIPTSHQTCPRCCEKVQQLQATCLSVMGQSPSPHISTEPHSPPLCPLCLPSLQKNISHRTNHFNLKQHASKNILRNVKVSFKKKNLQNPGERLAETSFNYRLGWFDKNSSLPRLWMTVFTQKTFFFKNNYSNPLLKWGLHFLIHPFFFSGFQTGTFLISEGKNNV